MSTHRLEPFARHLHPAETARFTGEGRHCGHRGCREPATIYAWYYPAALGGQIGSERQLCTAHGEAFAARQGLTVRPAPEEGDVPDHGPVPRPGARLSGMSADSIADHEANGWHCDATRCLRPARYFASLRYLQGGTLRHRSGFLCVRHALNFARRHGIDMAGVRAPEVTP
ncbi:MAG: hypothetical protein ACRDOU_05310 [Streptosporangiaceae bacterium]